MVRSSVIKSAIKRAVKPVIKTWSLGGSVTPVAPITAVNAVGWSVVYPSPPSEFAPDSSPESFVVQRQGYNSSGGTTTLTQSMIVTKRIRESWPNDATLTADQAAITDYIYSTDTVPSVTNNSTETSPKPIWQWGVMNRRVVGNSLYLELTAFHYEMRNREQVAAVEFTASDGVNPAVTQIVSISTISQQGLDQQPVICYATTLDISSLNSGDITVNARVFPWVGTGASIANSADGVEGQRGFTPLLFVKNTTLAATPPLVYVSTTGTDATVLSTGATSGGVQKVSTNPATAKANPFATAASALNALKAATSLTGGFTDGCEVRFMSGTHTTFTTPLAGTYTSKTGVIITRDPDVAQSAVTLSFSAAWNTRHSRVYLRGLQIVRTANVNWLTVTGTPSAIQLSDCVYNAGNFVGVLTSVATVIEYEKCIFNNCPVGPFNPGSPEHRRFRGCRFNTSTQIEGWSVIGCYFDAYIKLTYGARSLNNTIIAFNAGYRITDTMLATDAATQIQGFVVAQNVFEFISTGGTIIRMSADSAVIGITHLIFIHNTLPGFNDSGRVNIGYNDTTAPSNRIHKFYRDVGNIYTQRNTKHDIFAGTVGGHADASARTGGWSTLFGVSSASNVVMFADADSGVPRPRAFFCQEYGGLRSVFGTSNSVGLDVGFIDPKSTVNGSTPGVGGGNYRLQAGSIADNRVTPVLRFDLDGNARSASLATAGAYEL